MYKILKNNGGHQNVTLENTDTGASIVLGKISTKIVDIISRDGYTVSTDDIDNEKILNLTREWSFEVSKEVADELCRTAMVMRKPRRAKKSTLEPLEQPAVNNKEVDAMDVLFGLAHYSK